MPRFFMAGTSLAGGRAFIRGKDAEHVRVLRLRPGEDVVICDGAGKDYRCRIVSALSDEVEAEVPELAGSPPPAGSRPWTSPSTRACPRASGRTS